MPLPMVHLCVAKKIVKSQKISIEDISNFYLGIIAPDAVHMRNNFLPEDKKKSHLYARDISSINNVQGFICNHDKINIDFINGYAIHVLTDIYWNEYIYKQYEEKYLLDANPTQDQRMAYYSDTDQLDIILYNQPNRATIWDYLSKANGHTIKDIIFAGEIDQWNQRTLNWYQKERNYENPIKYITIDNINEFISLASKLCAEFLSSCTKS